MRSLGQELFAPPNVKGWDGGLAWITTNTLLARYNDAVALVNGTRRAPAARAGGNRRPNLQAQRMENRSRMLTTGGVDVDKILTKQERSDKELLIAALERRLLQAKLKDKQEAALREFLNAKGDLDQNEIRGAIRLVMSTPEYQLT